MAVGWGVGIVVGAGIVAVAGAYCRRRIGGFGGKVAGNRDDHNRRWLRDRRDWIGEG